MAVKLLFQLRHLSPVITTLAGLLQILRVRHSDHFLQFCNAFFLFFYDFTVSRHLVSFLETALCLVHRINAKGIGVDTRLK